MRKIAHLSDLHFGRTDPAVLPALAATIRAQRPDVIVVSGDLTQRAKTREFAAARDYLATLDFPQVVVPGNHDVPLYNVFRRFVHPLRRYRRFFGDETVPFHADGEIAIAGVNTARSLTFKDGRLNREQVALVCRRFEPLDRDVTRIVVTHHPFEGAGGGDGGLVGRADMAMSTFAQCGVDLILSGHLHASQSGPSDARYKQDGYAALLVQAGTATSVRRRGEPNSFNMIEVAPGAVTVERLAWDEKQAGFEVSARDHFTKTGGTWAPTPPSRDDRQ